MSAGVGFESLRLPGGERLGLVGAGLAFEVTDGWWAGPTVYGAATGRRGGLFVGGAEVQRRWALGQDVVMAAGLFAGGAAAATRRWAAA